MQPTQVGQRLAVVVEGATAGVSDGADHARACVDVPAQAWRTAVRAARDDTELACDVFDWLSAVDELDDGLRLVVHVWSSRHRHGILLRTQLPSGEPPEIDSLVDIYSGAAWHERETFEMFGVNFRGHPGGMRTLLLSPQFDGYPLRKDFLLSARLDTPWPGAYEPGESAGGTRRRPLLPPGVPAPPSP